MSEPSGSALARETLARLKSRITSGQWPVGTRIPTEPELTAELGVGRSTIREAIRSLATLGMVESLTARGTFVRSAAPAPSLLLDAISAYTPSELIGFRRALDVEAAQSVAARHTDPDLYAIEEALNDEIAPSRRGRAEAPATGAARCARFHGAIARACGNRLIADLDASLAAALASAGVAEAIAAPSDPAIVIHEHDRIFTAIRARDVGRAAHLMAVHVDSMLRAVAHAPILTELTTLSADGDVPTAEGAA